MTTLQLLNREIFLTAPPATCVWGASYYTRRDGLELLADSLHLRRSDTVECITEQHSPDNGRSWSEANVFPMGQKTAQGTVRRFPFPGYVCPHTGRLVRFRSDAVVPKDSPMDAARFWRTYYTVSEDGGRTNVSDEILQQKGEGFSPEHPLPNVWHGKNGITQGALSCAPMTLDKSTFLLPLEGTVLDDDGNLYSPGGGYGWFATTIVQGTWRADGGIDWKQLATMQGNPTFTTRGLMEGTLGLLDGGRILLVLRASNDANHNLPGHKWYCISEDGGHTWNDLQPWTFRDKSTFHSPSSCSQFVAHSSGALLWMGNICPTNPKGNLPRYPLVVGIVDKQSGLLDQNSLCLIDTKTDADHESMQFSNFYAREDRENGNLIIHCSRLAHGSPQGWQADAMIYRVGING